jgi:7,8-dihydropterin-6-yl-methyl-4-(beta-D-ribofuranosyl)aminobenzene 5'-phosphate synthase
MAEYGHVDRAAIVTVLEDYAGYETSYWAQHGISFLVDAWADEVRKRILVDVGQESQVVLHNMGLLGIEPDSIDMVFLSHCHYDHTGGLLGVLEAIGARDVPVVAHPAILRPTYVLRPHLRSIGVPWMDAADRIAEAGGHLVLVSEPFELMPGVVSTGEVPRVTAFEDSRMGGFVVEQGCLVPDEMVDDLSLVINVGGKSLSIVTGCGHAGIINIIRHATTLTGIERVSEVIGGFHLIEADANRIRLTAEALVELNAGHVVTGHCTGFAANATIAAALGSGFSLLHVGRRVELGMSD